MISQTRLLNGFLFVEVTWRF